MAIKLTKFTKTALGFGLALAVLNGCRKDVDLFIEHPASVKDIAATLEKLAQNDAPASIFDLKGSDQTAIFSMPDGSRLLLDDHTDELFADEATGAEVKCSACAEAKLEAFAVSSKGQMLAWRLSSATNNGQMLDVFSAFGLRATCDGKAMKLRDGKKIRLQTPANAATQKPVRLFFGEKNVKNQQSWAASADSEAVLPASWLAGGESQDGYEWRSERLGWLAAANAAPNVSSLTCVKMSAPFDPQNSMVFAVLKNQKAVIEFSATTTEYQMCAAALPVGEAVELLMISNIDGKWSLARLETVIEPGRETDLSGLSEPTDEAALGDLLKTV